MNEYAPAVQLVFRVFADQLPSTLVMGSFNGKKGSLRTHRKPIFTFSRKVESVTELIDLDAIAEKAILSPIFSISLDFLQKGSVLNLLPAFQLQLTSISIDTHFLTIRENTVFNSATVKIAS